MNEVIFFFTAICVCTFGFLTVLSRNIFHSAVWLALTLLAVSGVYFCLDAMFLGVVQVLVYVGGIITLFVFAIKLTAHIEDMGIRQTNRQVIPAVIVSIILFFFLFKIIGQSHWASGLNTHMVSVHDIGRALLSTYMLPFEFISLILLAALVGAIVIGKVKK